MTDAFKDLLKLLSSAVFNKEPETLSEEFEEILKLSLSHAVFPVFFLGAQKLYKRGMLNASESMYNSCMQSFVKDVAKNQSREYHVLSLLKEMNEKGIENAVVKGVLAADLYSEPGVRISGDTDIFISPCNEEDAMEFLKSKGMEISPRTKGKHHFEASSKLYGVIECHIRWNQDEISKGFFSGEDYNRDGFCIYTLKNGEEVKTFSPDDHMLFITIHAIKHFLNKGVGIRQIIDMALFYEKNADTIDRDRFVWVLEKTGYYKLFTSMMGIAVKYMDFPKRFDYEEKLADSLAEDIETSGLFGSEESLRAASKEYIIARRSEKSGYKYAKLIRKIFPTSAVMKNRFPYVKKVPALIVFAYLHRWIRLGVAVLKKEKTTADYFKNADADYNKVLGERVKLFEKLEII